MNELDERIVERNNESETNRMAINSEMSTALNKFTPDLLLTDVKDYKLELDKEKLMSYFYWVNNPRFNIFDITDVCEVAIALTEFNSKKIYDIIQKYFITSDDFGDEQSLIVSSSVYRLLIKYKELALLHAFLNLEENFENCDFIKLLIKWFMFMLYENNIRYSITFYKSYQEEFHANGEQTLNAILQVWIHW